MFACIHSSLPLRREDYLYNNKYITYSGFVLILFDRVLRLSHSHTGSYDFWIVRLVAIGSRCDRSAMFATIYSSGRIRRSISKRGRIITNDWRITMARAIVGNRATSVSDQRPMYDQLLRQTTDCTIIRGDRSYDQS